MTVTRLNPKPVRFDYGAQAWDVDSGNIHFQTAEDGQTQQAHFSIEKTGTIWVQTRSRSSASASWGAWSSWAKIAG